jgi:cytochrome c556
MAGALADSAREIPAAVQGVPMSEAERLAFATAAGRLERAAVQLGEAARRRSPEEIRAEARAIEAACSDCHTGFRATPTPSLP